MVGRVSVRVGVVLAALAMGGCAITDTVHPRAETINHSTEQARNASIILNIIRASQDAPLNFVAFSSVAGTTQLTGNAGLPNFLLGPSWGPAFSVLTGGITAGNGITSTGQAVRGGTPQLGAPGRDAIFGKDTLNGGGMASTQFSIAMFETKDFYAALLRPVDLPTLSFFIRQGYPRELLFWLFADSVEEVVQGKSYGYKYVPGQYEKSCNTVLGRTKCASDLIATAVALGLTVETKAIEKPSGQKTSTAVYARFCFDPLLQVRNELADTEEGRLQLAKLKRLMWSPSHLPRCRTHWIPEASKPDSQETATDTLEFQQPGTPVGTVTYRIVPRSTFGIYRFLGGLLAHGEAEGLIKGEPVDSNLLSITREGSASGCFQTAYYNGQNYCVPNDAKNTKSIIQLLAQLIALQTTTADLAVTPLVRVQN
jgi:hypothetical protein